MDSATGSPYVFYPHNSLSSCLSPLGVDNGQACAPVSDSSFCEKVEENQKETKENQWRADQLTHPHHSLWTRPLRGRSIPGAWWPCGDGGSEWIRTPGQGDVWPSDWNGRRSTAGDQNGWEEDGGEDTVLRARLSHSVRQACTSAQHIYEQDGLEEPP